MYIKSFCFKIVYVVTLFFLMSTKILVAQNQDLKLATEYYNNEEYEKAREIFEKLAKSEANQPVIYKQYVSTLIETKQYADAEKFIRKIQKNFPAEPEYPVDLYLIGVKYLNAEKSEKELLAYFQQIKANTSQVEKVAELLMRKGRPDKAKEIFLLSRKTVGDPFLYSFQLVYVYKMENRVDLLVNEMLAVLKAQPFQLENVKNTLQNLLSEKEEFDILESSLYERVQKDPDELSFNELLLWLNIQNKNFSAAYIQTKAIDKKSKLQGMKMIEVGRIAMENKEYEDAAKYFQYVTTEYKNGPHYPHARRLLINASEEVIKNTWPIDKARIISLVNEYNGLIKELGKTPGTLEAMRSLAQLYAFYLDKTDTAIVILEDAIANAKYDEKFKSRAKIDLGDMYLLKGEPWESTLLYSQVEKAQKEDPLGHEAKLKNAKLSYYKGEFQLAQDHLDVLKLATSREIANDAMNLSLLIQDNVGLDSNTAALKEYAAIDLLLFQNKNEEALTRLSEMLKNYPRHSLADEVLFMQAKIYRKSGKFTEAISRLEEIQKSFPDDILGDDALFMMGNIYEENLKDSKNAMEIYKNIMLKYPGSIYTAESRKRFRLLRGDKL